MIEAFNAAAYDKKLEILYQAEDALNGLWPAAENCARLLVEKDEKEQAAKKEFENIGGGKKATRFFLILSAVLAVLGLILPEGLLNFLAIFFLIGSVLMVIGCLVMSSSYKSNYKTASARVKELEPLIAAADKEVNAIKQRYAQGFAIRDALCPECKNPQTLRAFISYFESRRADTLKEAKNLFAQEMHQNRMEKLSQEQISAAIEARRAAERATSAAQSAAAAASAAKVSSDAAWREAQKH